MHSWALSENGWTDDELGVEYIEEFDRQTDDGSGETRLLLVDGHHSHCTNAFIDYAGVHDIELGCYYPHATHLLQGLDVAVFGALKIYYGQEKDKLEESGDVVSKDNFVEVYSRAHVRAFTKKTILSAFRKTGIHPFDPSVITEEQLAPSFATSTRASFAVTSSIPVECVTRAFDSVHVPLTPTRSGSPDEPVLSPHSMNIDPTLLTPTKRGVRLMFEHFHTEGYDHLIPGNQSFSLDTTIPPPMIVDVPTVSVDHLLDTPDPSTT